MRKLTIALLFILGFSVAAVFAQSGRRAKPTPTPLPETVEKSAAGDFSESTPNQSPAIYLPPAKRKKDKSKNKTETPTTNQTAPTVQTPAPNPDGEDEVVKVETNLVTIPVSVYERSGVYVSGLRQTDFKIYENGVEQEIAYFGTTEKPFTVILLIDISPSTTYKIEEIQAAATAFVDQLKAQDNVMVIAFDQNVRVLAELTNDRQKIYKAIERTGFGNGTSLYEAVDFSLRKKLAKIEGRKSVVLFTDGVDTTSRGDDFDSTLRDASESDSIIFPVYYNTYLASRGIGQGGAMSVPPMLPQMGGMQGMSSADYARGRAYLEALAGVTGGKVFRPESTPGGLTAAFEGIAEELRNQYSIGYYPQTESEKGERKQIKVRVNRPNVAVRARDSYVVGANETTPAASGKTQKFK